MTSFIFVWHQNIEHYVCFWRLHNRSSESQEHVLSTTKVFLLHSISIESASLYEFSGFKVKEVLHMHMDTAKPRIDDYAIPLFVAGADD